VNAMNEPSIVLYLGTVWSHDDAIGFIQHSCIKLCFVWQRNMMVLLTGDFFITLQKMTCYFDNCICYQNCNCDMVLRDDAMLVPCETSMGNVGNATLVEYSNN